MRFQTAVVRWRRVAYGFAGRRAIYCMSSRDRQVQSPMLMPNSLGRPGRGVFAIALNTNGSERQPSGVFS